MMHQDNDNQKLLEELKKVINEVYILDAANSKDDYKEIKKTLATITIIENSNDNKLGPQSLFEKDAAEFSKKFQEIISQFVSKKNAPNNPEQVLKTIKSVAELIKQNDSQWIFEQQGAEKKHQFLHNTSLTAAKIVREPLVQIMQSLLDQQHNILNSLVTIWLSQNKEQKYDLAQPRPPSTQNNMKSSVEIDKIIDMLLQLPALSSHSQLKQFLGKDVMENTNFRHAVAQRMYERSLDAKSPLNLREFLAQKDSTLHQWLSTPTSRGLTHGLSRLWGGTTSSMRWLKEASDRSANTATLTNKK